MVGRALADRATAGGRRLAESALRPDHLTVEIHHVHAHINAYYEYWSRRIALHESSPSGSRSSVLRDCFRPHRRRRCDEQDCALAAQAPDFDRPIRPRRLPVPAMANLRASRTASTLPRTRGMSSRTRQLRANLACYCDSDQRAEQTSDE